MTTMPTAEGEALLAEAVPSSLDLLFSRDPEGYSQRDIAEIVAELRAQRVRYDAAEAAGKRPPRPKSAPKAKALKASPANGDNAEPELDFSEAEL